MKDLRIFTIGETVLIKAEVKNVKLCGNDVEYLLADPKSGHEYKFMYKPEEVFKVSEHEVSEMPEK